MRNLKPIHVLLAGSSIVTVTVFAVLLLFFMLNEDVGVFYLLVIPPISGVVSYFAFHFFIRNFITDRLRILYRSIRKGKFGAEQSHTIKMADDPISHAEIETKRWTDERIAEISQLKEKEQFRREFLGNLAHELKTPVFSVQGYILTLLEGGLEDEKVNRNFLERASKATERMSAILEDLDQLMKMEVNEIKLEFENFDLKELIQDIFEDLERTAKQKKIKMVFTKDYNPQFVNADKGKIGQVLTNLIGNSIAYGNERGETLVSFYSVDDITTVEVADNGPGIDEEHLPRLFERFYRVEKSRNRNKGGSGLGLAIAKHIVEAHGQTISVRSTPGLGSTFTFSLDKAKRESI